MTEGFNRDELDMLIRDGDGYRKLRKGNNQAKRKHYGYRINTCQVIHDPVEIYQKGFLTECASNELRFKSIVYSLKALGKMLSRGGEIPFDWERRFHGPIAIFNGYLPFKIGRMKEPGFRWRRVYLYEEVLVITKWYAEHNKYSRHFSKTSPEYCHLWDELEEVRDEIKRRAKSGEPTVWTGFRGN
jgi:hypothetical protein